MRAYQELKSSARVAAHLGIGGTTVERILRRNKVVRDGRNHYLQNIKAYSPEVEKLIAKKYKAGAWACDLIKEYGGTNYSIDRTLERLGIKKRADTAPPPTDEELEKIKDMYEDGMSQMQISLELNRSTTFISGMIKKYNIYPNHPRGHIRNPNKLYRKEHKGYMWVMLERDDPYYAMAHLRGYVNEHRIVMARHLGRCLTKSETVHHINGNGLDNRLENLQLRQGRHGKGAVAYCIECGSHNIGHKALPEHAV